MKSKTNIVLVHGAWADGASWSKVIPLLQQKEFNVTAAQIPLTSLADDIAVTRNLMAAQKGPTILVGHSYAGVVISGAANDAPSVEALVYIAAFALDEGERIDALKQPGTSASRRCGSTTARRAWLSLDRSRWFRQSICRQCRS